MKCKNYRLSDCQCNKGVELLSACFYPGGHKPDKTPVSCGIYEPWPEIDMDFFKEFVNLYNQVAFRKKTQEDFNKFVLENKDKLNNPDYLSVFSEDVELLDIFYKENFEMCKFFYDFMEETPGWIHLDYGLRTSMRLAIFQDLFKKYLEGLATNDN